tara:strand:- start:1910 stop:3589 length:1680 start_codon:yes stop_codon:yes gene_type:complete
MKKYSLILIIASFIIYNSCSSGNEKKIVLDIKPPVTAKDAKNAFNLLEQASNERRYNNDNTKSVRGYISLIEKEPNFVPAYLDFFRWVFDEEVYIDDKEIIASKYQVILDSIIKNGTEYEKLIYKADSIHRNNPFGDSLSWVKKHEITRKLVMKFPNSADAFFIKSRYHPNNNTFLDGRQRDKRLDAVKRALELKPNSFRENFVDFIETYSASGGGFGTPFTSRIKNDPQLFKSFEDDAKSLINKFPDVGRVYRVIGVRYLGAYDYENNYFIDQAIYYLDKYIELLGESDELSEALYYKARAYMLIGDYKKAKFTLLDNIEKATIDYRIITSYFHLILFYTNIGDYVSAIKQIDDFEGSLQGFGFSDENILQCKVGLSNYRTIIYAHLNQPERSKKAFLDFESNAKNLSTFYNINPNNQKETTRLINVKGGFDQFIRWYRFRTNEMEFDRRWITILNADFNKGRALIDDYEKSSGGGNNDFLKGMILVLSGESKKAEELLDEISIKSLPYAQYFRAQAKIDLGKTEEAKILLDSIVKSTPINFMNDLVMGRARSILNSL